MEIKSLEEIFDRKGRYFKLNGNNEEVRAELIFSVSVGGPSTSLFVEGRNFRKDIEDLIEKNLINSKRYAKGLDSNADIKINAYSIERSLLNYCDVHFYKI